MGVNFFDTAEIYDFGVQEINMGLALKALKKELIFLKDLIFENKNLYKVIYFIILKIRN